MFGRLFLSPAGRQFLGELFEAILENELIANLDLRPKGIGDA